MRIIKLGLISVVFFAVMITLVSLLFPSHVRISKAVDINSDKETVLAQLKDTSNWKNWYPGADSSMPVVELTATDSSIQFHQVGNVNRSGEGFNIMPVGQPHTVTVQWYMDIHLHWYPWEKFSSLLLENRYGPFMERGLTRLKAYLEK